MANIRIEVSARHCHLSQEHLDKLFGVGHTLTPLKELSQPGQFAAQETVVLKTEAGWIGRLRVLGPVRNQTQVELSQTDARQLKINPPVRLSGDIKGSVGGTLIGPAGEVVLEEGIIVAQRHIHASPAQAEKLKLIDGQSVSIKTSGERGVTFHNCLVRVSDKYDLSLHIDTDEGNAAMLGGVCGEGLIVLNDYEFMSSYEIKKLAA